LTDYLPITANKQLFYSFKRITSYKNNGSNPVKSVIGRYKINLEMLRSYKSCKAVTDFIQQFSKTKAKILEKLRNQEYLFDDFKKFKLDLLGTIQISCVDP
jgi:hypothetical protein